MRARTIQISVRVDTRLRVLMERVAEERKTDLTSVIIGIISDAAPGLQAFLDQRSGELAARLRSTLLDRLRETLPAPDYRALERVLAVVHREKKVTPQLISAAIRRATMPPSGEDGVEISDESLGLLVSLVLGIK